MGMNRDQRLHTIGNDFPGIICKDHHSNNPMTNGLSQYKVQVLLSKRLTNTVVGLWIFSTAVFQITATSYLREEQCFLRSQQLLSQSQNCPTPNMMAHYCLLQNSTCPVCPLQHNFSNTPINSSHCCSFINPLPPNFIYIYMLYRTANPQTLHFKYFFNKYPY
jgi:hypothetical protein